MACRRKVLQVTLSDTRTLLGTLLAFDAHMNVVLGDTEEYRLVKEAKKTKEVREKGAPGEEPTWVEEKRLLGLVLLRGETVISMTAEDPPQPPPRVAPGTLATPLPIPMMPGMPMGGMPPRPGMPPMMGRPPMPGFPPFGMPPRPGMPGMPPFPGMFGGMPPRPPQQPQ